MCIRIEESVPDSTSEGTTTNVRSTNKKESGEEGHVATPTSPVPDVLSEGVKVENNTRRTSEATSIASMSSIYIYISLFCLFICSIYTHGNQLTNTFVYGILMIHTEWNMASYFARACILKS